MNQFRRLFLLLSFFSAFQGIAGVGPELLVGREPLAGGTQTVHDAFFDGTNHVVLWSEYDGEHKLKISRISPDGSRHDGTGVPLPQRGILQPSARLASNGSIHFVAWLEIAEDYSSERPMVLIRGARVDRNLSLLDPASLELGEVLEGSQVDVSATDSGFFVVTTGDYDQGITGRVVSRGGEVGDSFTIVDHSQWIESLAIESNGRTQLLAWGRYYFIECQVIGCTNTDLWSLRLDSMGGPLDVPQLLGPRQRPRIATDGSDFVLIAEDFDEDYKHQILSLTRISELGGILGHLPYLSAGYHGTITWNGREYVAAWARDSFAYGGDIYYVPITQTLELPAGMQIGQSFSAAVYWSHQQRPEISGFQGQTAIFYSRLVDGTTDPPKYRAAFRLADDEFPVLPWAPINVSAKQIDAGWFEIKWSPSAADVFRYRVEGLDDEGRWEERTVVGSTANSAIVQFLHMGPELRFRVFAENPGGISAPSQESEPILNPPIAPPAPLNIRVEVNGLEATVHWDDGSTTEAGFIVEILRMNTTHFDPVAYAGWNETKATFRFPEAGRYLVLVTSYNQYGRTQGRGVVVRVGPLRRVRR